MAGAAEYRPLLHKDLSDMELELSGKRAIVCGSSQGSGLGCAVALAEAGVEVTLNGRSEDRLAKTRSDLGSRSPPHRRTERLASYVATLARTGGISKSDARQAFVAEDPAGRVGVADEFGATCASWPVDGAASSPVRTP